MITAARTTLTPPPPTVDPAAGRRAMVAGLESAAEGQHDGQQQQQRGKQDAGVVVRRTTRAGAPTQGGGIAGKMQDKKQQGSGQEGGTSPRALRRMSGKKHQHSPAVSLSSSSLPTSAPANTLNAPPAALAGDDAPGPTTQGPTAMGPLQRLAALLTGSGNQADAQKTQNTTDEVVKQGSPSKMAPSVRLPTKQDGQRTVNARLDSNTLIGKPPVKQHPGAGTVGGTADLGGGAGQTPLTAASNHHSSTPHHAGAMVGSPHDGGLNGQQGQHESQPMVVNTDNAPPATAAATTAAARKRAAARAAQRAAARGVGVSSTPTATTPTATTHAPKGGVGVGKHGTNDVVLGGGGSAVANAQHGTTATHTTTHTTANTTVEAPVGGAPVDAIQQASKSSGGGAAHGAQQRTAAAQHTGASAKKVGLEGVAAQPTEVQVWGDVCVVMGGCCICGFDAHLCVCG